MARKLGEHRGLAHYTVGQRKGLGVAAANPLFVNRIDAANNAVIVGPRAALAHPGLSCEGATWTQNVPTSGARLDAQTRAHAVAFAGTLLRADENGFALQFDEPSGGVSPGQLCVLYDGDEVVGAGTIL